MNLHASSRRTSNHGAKVFAAAFSLAAIIAAQWPSQASAADHLVLLGSNVTLVATADGSPAPTFQWHKNGVAIVGATSDTLVFAGVTTADAAVYQVVATNEAGSAASPEEVLVVGTASDAVAPVFTTQPEASLTGSVGGSATFTVSASGLPSPTYQWQKNGVVIEGATSANLVLDGLAVSDSASYAAVATNSAGSVMSNPAVLTVTESASPLSPSPTDVAPVIASQPTPSQTVVAGSSVTFSVTASGSPVPSFQWRKNGTNISGATSASLSLASVTSADAATYSVMASNAAGSVVSQNSILYVQSAPTFTVQPLPQSVTPGSTAKFSVGVQALPGATLQWHKNGSPISGATSAVLYLYAVSTSDAGTYSVVAKNTLGATTSDGAALVIGAPPIITKQPVSQIVTQKSTVTFTAAASGSPAPAFQWKKNGVEIVGATGSTLTLKAVNKSNSGDYAVEARNALGWVSSTRAALVVENDTGKRSKEDELSDPYYSIDSGAEATGLVNLSVRAHAGTGDNGLIVGFVIDGTSAKSLLVRGVGPALSEFGVSGVLADPQLALYSGTVVRASNDDWSDNENAAMIAGTSVQVGAFGLVDQAADSALMTTLENGAYTVQLSGKESSTGVGLVEVYDATSSGMSRLVNLSVRAHIGTDADVPMVGFVIAGSSPRRVMIRAVGPTLAAFGVNDSIVDPQLELFQGSSRIDQNDNWGGSADLSSTFAQVGAFGLEDGSSKDAVLLTVLEPGAYTVVVSGVDGTTGVGLVEVYDVP